jgi:hypothetical protein
VRARAALWLPLAALAFTSQARAQDALDPTSARAVRAFSEVCLANAASFEAARAAATAAPWSFQHSEDLPAYGGGPPMQGFVSGDVELLLRQGKKGAFGCLVMFKMPDGTSNEQLRDGLSKTPGLTLTNPGGGGDFRAEWRSPSLPAGSKVQLTVYNKMKPRAPILDLESKGMPH